MGGALIKRLDTDIAEQAKHVENCGKASPGDSAVPILILILLVVLVAQIGFWNTLGSVLGAIGVVILTLVIVAVLIAAIAIYFLGRVRGRP